MFKTKRNKKEKGQGLVEYALILVLVAIVVIAVLMLLGPIIGNVFSTVNDSLSSVSGGGGDSVIVQQEEDPQQAYKEWCDSLGFPYHMNAGGVCVKGN
jgi:pilus assembly protein Flp/PilA